MSRYFIDRPIFAWVLAIILMLAGLLALRTLPIAQFPEIAAPAVTIATVYPGADAQTLENTTTQIIEQQLKGIDHLRYFSSSSDSAGNLTITLTFEQGTNPDTAQVQVQNKLAQATPLLPQEVQQAGLRVSKSTANFLLVAAVYSEDGSHDQVDLGDFIASSLQDPLSRINGVGDTQLFGAQYAMRIWVDPFKLSNLGLTVGDVKAAIQAQNAQVSAGQIGSTPTVRGQALNATVTAQSRLRTPEQFRQILLRSNSDGSMVRLADVARVDLGRENYSFQTRYQRQAGRRYRHQAGTRRQRARHHGRGEGRNGRAFASNSRADIKVVYPLDNSTFVRLSVDQVVHTLIEAIILVFVVMFVFLQNWRATLIPTIAVPVVLLGALRGAAGRRFHHQHAHPVRHGAGDRPAGRRRDRRGRECRAPDPRARASARRKRRASRWTRSAAPWSASAWCCRRCSCPWRSSADRPASSIRQFSITIVSSMALSVLVALILTPALCATILKPANPDHKAAPGLFRLVQPHLRSRHRAAMARASARSSGAGAGPCWSMR